MRRIASLLTGLALSNQHTAVLFVVPLGARALSIAAPSLKKRPREVVVLGLYGLTGLSPYAYLPLATPKARWLGPRPTLWGFMHHFLRRDYGTLRLYSGRVGSGESLMERIEAWYTSVSYVQGPYLMLYRPGSDGWPACSCTPPLPDMCDDASSQGGGKKSAQAQDGARSRSIINRGAPRRGPSEV